MFNSLFKDMQDVNHYLPIENFYLEKIKKTVNEKNIILENEIYPFLKIILLCLGKLFKYDYKEKNLILKEENKIEILEYFNETLIYFHPYIIENYDIIKRYYLIYLNNVNTSSINLETESNNNNFFLNNEQFKDYLKLIECSYYLLLNFITDVSNGKEYYSMIEKNLYKRINNKEENNKFEEIFLIIILKIIKESDNLSKILIFSLIEYICGKIIEDLDYNSNFFYDILISYNLLIIDDENLQEKSMKLFAEIFMEEIKIEHFQKYFFTKINDLIIKKNNKNFELILPLLMYISTIFKNENENIKIKVLNTLTNILNKYSDKHLYFKFQQKEIDHQKYDSDFFSNIFGNFNIFTNPNSEKNIELVKEYFNFYITFLLFLNTNFNYQEIGTDISERKIIISVIILYIYKLIVLSENTIDFIPTITLFIKQLIYYIKVYLKSNPNNSFLIYINLSIRFKELIKSNFQNLSYIPYLSYYISLFILIEIIKTNKLTISLSNIHNKIISETKNLEENFSNLIQKIQINELSTIDYNESQINTLENDLIYNFNNCQNFNINEKKYEQIMEIIYSKYFGKSTNLFSCLEPQLNSSERAFDILSNSNQTDDISIVQNNSNSFLRKIDDRSDISTDLNNNNNNENNIEKELNESLPSIQNKYFNINYNSINISINNENDDENIKY